MSGKGNGIWVNPGTLIWVTIAVMKHDNQKEPWEEMFYFTHSYIKQFVLKSDEDRNSGRAGTWSRSGCRGHGGVRLTALLLMACSACFLIHPRTTSPEVAPPTMGGSSPLVTK